MTGSKLQKFIQYLQTRNLVGKDDIIQSANLMSKLDRRIGQMGVMRGYIRPEDVNSILNEQAGTGKLFGECSIRMDLMSPDKVKRLLDLQKDEIYLFAQSAIIQKITTPDRIAAHVQEFMKTADAVGPDAQSAAADAAGPPIKAEIKSVLGRVTEFGALPQSVLRLMSVIDNKDVDMDKVTELLSADPGLVATLLRVVNSAYHGMREEIKSVKQAVVAIGIDKLRSLIITVGLVQKYHGLPPAVAQPYWNHAVRTAEWAKLIGRQFEIGEGDEVYLCGLLHNAGELLIYQFFRAQKLQIDERVSAGTPQPDAERAVLGGTHADIAGFLFSHWKLPAAVVQSAMYHHQHPLLLLNIPNLLREVFLVNMAVAVGGLDTHPDAFEYAELLDKLGNHYQRLLKLQKNINMNKIAADVEENVRRFSGLTSR